ncbi:MAG TPA: sialate O-acetylesterase [Luteitalea sp.]|nr:sialate O-acetylesterase [Luteitalea sp.]
MPMPTHPIELLGTRTSIQTGARGTPLRRLRHLLLLVLATGVSLGAQSSLPPRESLQVFLLLGQSNMAGRGVLDDEATVPARGVLMLDRSGTWVPAIDPMHFDKPIAGVGLGRSFAATVGQAHPGIVVGLVPAAVGGSPIDSWMPGAIDAATKTHPWDDAIARAKVALVQGTLKGILWHQGESDSTAILAPAYAGKLEALVVRLRQTLNAPDVPFIAGQMGKFEGAPWDDARKTVDEAHRRLPKTATRTAYVSSEGLNHKGDRLHFDTPSLRELGRRYARAYLALTQSGQ